MLTFLSMMDSLPSCSFSCLSMQLNKRMATQTQREKTWYNQIFKREPLTKHCPNASDLDDFLFNPNVMVKSTGLLEFVQPIILWSIYSALFLDLWAGHRYIALRGGRRGTWPCPGGGAGSSWPCWSTQAGCGRFGCGQWRRQCRGKPG